MAKICLFLGTRPEIIKMSPIVRECQNRNTDFFIIHTNQHYSENLDKVFIEELNLPNPSYNLKASRDSQIESFSSMLTKAEKVLKKEDPDIVLVQGDTNSVLAGALVSAKMNVPVGHIEAGLRSYFREMPEELNRVLTDHASDMLFAPTKKQFGILKNEGIREDKIFVTGNTIVDAVQQNLEIARSKSSIISDLNLKKGNYFVLTAHRAENVDKKERLEKIIEGLKLIENNFDFPVIYPIHPRTKKRVKEFSLSFPDNVKLIEPLGYFDFIYLQSKSSLILTDSGGVQEESCILGVPCITLRDNTERPETIDVGANKLVGVEPEEILKGVKIMKKKNGKWNQPFGDGKAAEKIINLILKKYE